MLARSTGSCKPLFALRPASRALSSSVGRQTFGAIATIASPFLSSMAFAKASVAFGASVGVPFSLGTSSEIEGLAKQRVKGVAGPRKAVTVASRSLKKLKASGLTAAGVKNFKVFASAKRERSAATFEAQVAAFHRSQNFKVWVY